MLIEQTAEEVYDPGRVQDDAKARVLALIDQKIAGKEIVTSAAPEKGSDSAKVIDLMEALRASLAKTTKTRTVVSNPKVLAKNTPIKKDASVHQRN